MSRNLPIKTSSRAGRFKKKLVNPEVLLIEAPIVSAKTAPILERYRRGKFNSSEFAAAYLVLHLSTRYPGNWLGSKKESMEIETPSKISWRELEIKFERNIEERLKDYSTIAEIFQNFALKSTPLTVNRSVLSWLNGTYPLELMFRIPMPKEVLSQQKKGHRCVTILHEVKDLSEYVLGERDALGFTMHDLIHADHFYHHPEVFEGQLGFYGLLDYCMTENHFEEHLKNPKFASEFEYLISDMNAYAVHLMKCFKSALIHFHTNGETFFKDWVVKLDADEKETRALEELNSVQYVAAEQDAMILKFLSKWKVKN